MSQITTFRVSDNFKKQLQEVKKMHRENGIKFTNEELLDDMMSLYYSFVFLKGTNNAVMQMFTDVTADVLDQFTTMNAKFHNALLEEIKSIMLNK